MYIPLYMRVAVSIGLCGSPLSVFLSSCLYNVLSPRGALRPGASYRVSWVFVWSPFGVVAAIGVWGVVPRGPRCFCVLTVRGRDFLYCGLVIEELTVRVMLLATLNINNTAIFNTLVNFVFGGVSRGFSSVVLSFTTNIVLTTTILNLILPSLRCNTGCKRTITVLVAITNVFANTLYLGLVSGLIPRLRRVVNESARVRGGSGLGGILLFIVTVTVRGLPRNLTTNINFNSNGAARTLVVTNNITLRGVPRNVIVVKPVLTTNMSPMGAFLVTLVAKLVRMVNAFVNFFTIDVSATILPFTLTFTNNAVLCMVDSRVVPRARTRNGRHNTACSLLINFYMVLVASILLKWGRFTWALGVLATVLRVF